MIADKHPKISINLVVFNGERYIRHCLNSIKDLNYPHDCIEIGIWDNNSTDSSLKIIREEEKSFEGFQAYNYISHPNNIGMWAGQEKLLDISSGEYVVVLSVDVILDKNFLTNSIPFLQQDSMVGAIQAKIYSFSLVGDGFALSNVIDTCGFKIFRSRRIVNIGHGEEDCAQHDVQKEIFGTEGAVPIFRKTAFESLKINGEIFDHDFFWYAEDLDIAWRMNMFGWRQIYMPDTIAWHDRKTTKVLSGGLKNFINARRLIPIQKRRLEFRNIRWSIIKNDYAINIIKDLLYITRRELMMLAYLLFFEPKVLTEIPKIFAKLPKMLAKRRQVMNKCNNDAIKLRRWFN